MKPHKRDKQCILYPGVHYLNSEKTRVADASLCTQCQEITEGFKVRALGHPLNRIVLCFKCEAIKEKPYRLESSADVYTPVIVELTTGQIMVLKEKYAPAPVLKVFWKSSQDELICYGRKQLGSIIQTFWEDPKTLKERTINFQV
jgi:hypothetical protein